MSNNESVLAWGAQKRELTDLPEAGVVPSQRHAFAVFYGADEPSLNSFVYDKAPPASAAASVKAQKRAMSAMDGSYWRAGGARRRRPPDDAVPTPTSVSTSGGTNAADEQSLLHRARRVLSLPSSVLRRASPTRQRSLPRPAFVRAARSERSNSAHTLRLEEELHAERSRADAAEKRVAELERLLDERTRALPALDELLRTALAHFEVKERALKAQLAAALNGRALPVQPDPFYPTEPLNTMSPPTSTSNASNSNGSTTLRP